MLFIADPLLGFAFIAGSGGSTSLGNVTDITVRNASCIAVAVSFIGISVSALPSVALDMQLVVSVVAKVNITQGGGSGGNRCFSTATGASSNASGSVVVDKKLVFGCILTPLKKSQNARLQKAVQTTFRSTTTASGLLMNPVTAMTNTGMVSILSLQQCVFSDVEPLDPSMSPLNLSAGDEVGQYYRGAVLAGLGVYGGAAALAALILVVLRFGLGKKRSFEMLRFPSILMVVVSLFHQGIVMSGTALVRLNASPVDVALGFCGIGIEGLITAAVVIATTKKLSCRLLKRSESVGDEVGDPALPYERYVPGLSQFLKIATWDCRWVDGNIAGYKRRHLLLLSDLRLPWWTAMELSSGIAQGIIVGIRKNDDDVCRQQLIALVLHCVIMLGLAMYFRPCGSMLGNVFLVASKLGGLLVAALELYYIYSTNDAALSASDLATAAFTFVSTVQTATQVIAAVVMTLRRLSPSIRRHAPSRMGGDEDSRGRSELAPIDRKALFVPILETDATQHQSSRNAAIVAKTAGRRRGRTLVKQPSREVFDDDPFCRPDKEIPDDVGDDDEVDDEEDAELDLLFDKSDEDDPDNSNWGQREFLLDDIVRGLTDAQAWRQAAPSTSALHPQLRLTN